MNEHIHTYQAMFLLDNQEVRKGFNAQRDWVQQTLEKHGLTVKVLRLWGERPLAYPIRGRRRATFILGWLEGSGPAVNKVKREMYLLGPVFRTLFLREDEIPAEELQFGVEEVDEASLVIPDDLPEEEEEDYEEPPSDDESDERSERSDRFERSERSDKPAAKSEVKSAAKSEEESEDKSAADDNKSDDEDVEKKEQQNA